jgi:hypothetical protein
MSQVCFGCSESFCRHTYPLPLRPRSHLHSLRAASTSHSDRVRTASALPTPPSCFVAYPPTLLFRTPYRPRLPALSPFAHPRPVSPAQLTCRALPNAFSCSSRIPVSPTLTGSQRLQHRDLLTTTSLQKNARLVDIALVDLYYHCWVNALDATYQRREFTFGHIALQLLS